MGQFTTNSPLQKQKLIDAAKCALVRFIGSNDAGYIRPIDKENELPALVAAYLYDFGLPETVRESISTDEWSRLVDKLESDTFSADDFVRTFQYMAAIKADEITEKKMGK